jgi:hypothetical protein
MEENLQLLAELWIGYKTRLIEYVGLTNDAMHVHGSILILFASAVVLRRRPDSIWCWLIVFAAELFNEFADLKGLAPGEASIDASIHDLYNTMLWPTVIVILGRVLFPQPRKALLQQATDSSDFADQAFEKPTTV